MIKVANLEHNVKILFLKLVGALLGDNNKAKKRQQLD